MLSQIHIIIEILSNFKDFLYMVEGDTENQFKKSGKFSQAIKSVSKNLNLAREEVVYCVALIKN